MADFVSVLRRAVGNLESNTEAARQAIYGKARAALRAQLEAIDPPLGPDDITRQIQSLDRAIGELEAEFAVAAAAPAPTPPAPPPAPAPATPAPAAPTPATPAPQAAQRPQPAPKPAATQAAAPAPKAHPSFQSAVSESGGLGAAASTAARQARATLDRIDGEDSGLGGAEAAALSPARHEPVLGSPRPAERQTAPKVERPAPPAAVYDEDEEAGERGGAGRVVAWVILALVLAGIAGVGYWQRATVMDMIASLTGAGEPAATGENGKIVDRVPAPGGQSTEAMAPQPVQPAPVEPAPAEPGQTTGQVPAPAAPPSAAEAEGDRVAQALLIEESTGGVSPANTVGGAINWQLVDDTEAVGGIDKIIRGDVEVPEKGLGMTVTIRRNKDQALPASHLIELVFRTAEGFPHGGIAGIPGIIMKATPRSTGQPLVGAVVPVMDGYFLVGLSESEIDRERNVEELTTRDFIDVPVVYKDGGRAVLSLAKGETGARVFNDAFGAWSQ